MDSSIFKPFLAILTLSILSFFILTINSENSEKQLSLNTDNFAIITDTSTFYWPLPGNQNITSYFGKRKSPTSGASTYHSGIDIAATEGTPIYACFSGTVTFTGFKGAGGYTITIENGNFTSSYCHVSPNFLYNVGDYILAQNIISNVGPKYVYGVINNPYKDSSGTPTNGATTGCHLHLTIKKDGKAVNPLLYF